MYFLQAPSLFLFLLRQWIHPSRLERYMEKPFSHSLLIISLLLFQISSPAIQSAFASPLSTSPPPSYSQRICVIGSGIAGSTVSHFLKEYSSDPDSLDIQIFERHAIVGGRMATVTIAGETFEAGATILHPKNLHALKFTSMLDLRIRTDSNKSDSSSWFGIWDGHRFIFKTLPPPSPKSGPSFYGKIVSFLNSLLIFCRYGFSLQRMSGFVNKAVGSFLRYYESFESRPVFSTVEEMLKWSGLYSLTRRTLQEELTDAGLSQRLISELVTVISRINYGQDASISGFAGAVSLAGSESGLWSVEGGNWQIAAGLIRHSNASLHLEEDITSVTFAGDFYELNSTRGNSYRCDITVVSTPLDEIKISFAPAISIPNRKLQHTHATFVRGLLNPDYFGLKSAPEIPELVGTTEVPDIPFSSISVLKKYSAEDMAYKVFSRAALTDELLDQIFSVRKETIKIDWPAYPHFQAPEVFAPFLLDGHHLYYINAFENAASTMETSAVAAENVARLIHSRMGSMQKIKSPVTRGVGASYETKNLHDDL